MAKLVSNLKDRNIKDRVGIKGVEIAKTIKKKKYKRDKKSVLWK